MIDNHSPGGPESLAINLRRSQASFLSELTRVTELSAGEVFERLIAMASDPEAKRQQELLFSESVQSELSRFVPVSVGRHWNQVEIQLDHEALQKLDVISRKEASSRSRKLRHLLADFMVASGVQSRRRARQRSRQRLARLLTSKRVMWGVGGCFAVLILLVALHDPKPTLSGPEWAGNEASLILDPSTHTSYSDGELSPGELVAMAVAEGCDALVISDHSSAEGTVSEAQIREFGLLRERYQDLFLFAGIELNMPSYGDRERATLIASPAVDGATLREIRDLAEEYSREPHSHGVNRQLERSLLQRIADHQDRYGNLLLFYNHPAKSDPEIFQNFEDVSRWNADSRVFAALEGAPGGQKSEVVGAYKAPLFTVDRWDPVVAEVGGVWDQLLSHGHDIWGALGSSAYRNSALDNPPCAFTRTHLAVPERSYRGVLAALKAGTFWTDHGRILDQLSFSAQIEEMEGGDAHPGTTVQLTGGEEQATLNLSLERGPRSVGRSLLAEFISSCRLGVAEALPQQWITPAEKTTTLTIPLSQAGEDDESCTVRARIRLQRDDEADFMAYTNHIRFMFD